MANMRELREIAVADIVIDEGDNSRVKPVGVDALADSIRENGLINPITVIEKDSKYRVVAGFNRAHAVKKLDLDTVNVVVDKSNDPKKHLLLQISENLDRNNFTTYETAYALKRLEDSGMTRADMSGRLRRSQAWISNYLGLFDLPQESVEFVRENPDDMQVAHVRFVHAQAKYLDADQVVELTKAVKGLTQTDLATLRTKMEQQRKRDEGSSEEGDEEITEKPTRKVRTKVAESSEEASDDVPEDEGGPRICRNAVFVREALMSLSRTGANMEGAALAKYQGAIEALQWILGDDEIPLFESIGSDADA